jgi:hypothetical protein
MAEQKKTEEKKTFTELFDWIINKKMLRGSKKGDEGLWMNNSEKPKFFCTKSRIVELDDGKQFLIKKETSCTALNLNKQSEQLLTSLPVKTYNTI